MSSRTGATATLARVTPGEPGREGVREHTKKRDGDERGEDECPNAQSDPQRGSNAKEGARGEREASDDELEEENGEGELLEIVRRRVRLAAPGWGLRRCRLQDVDADSGASVELK